MEATAIERVVPKFSWSEMTCGESCWTGQEDNCKCSCNGKNHGIWRNNKSVNVQRTSKINGVLYNLVGVGTREDLLKMQIDLLGKYGVSRCYDYYGNGDYIHRSYRDSFKSRGDNVREFPVVMKNATDSQMARWHELQAFTKYEGHNYYFSIALLWEIFIVPAPCVHTCQNAKSIEEHL